MADTAALLAHTDPAAVVAYVRGRAVTAATFVADVARVQARLPARRYVVNACDDRYRFAVTFCAALAAGRVNLLPGSRAAGVLADLAARYPDHVLATDHDLYAGFTSAVVIDELPGTGQAWPPPQIARAAEAAIAFTSGTTGVPLPQIKNWGSLVDSARAERAGLRFDADDRDVVLVGTVGPQHMYGLESTLLLALHAPFAFVAEQPLHPEQIAASLAALPSKRVLVTTPVHLRALDASAVALPPLDRIVCATAPLATELAARCETRWHTEVFEIYGCTETGQVASRRTVEGPWWKTLAGVHIEERDDAFWASGGPVWRAAPLADRLQLRDAETFMLEGRIADLVKVAGKRASLASLNHILLAIDGVTDGTFFLPDEAPGEHATRLMAFVVAPGQTRAAILAALRERIDPAFLPRPLVLVDALPRNRLTGKLPRAELAALVRTHGSER